jgi:hypothetical protein
MIKVLHSLNFQGVLRKKHVVVLVLCFMLIFISARIVFAPDDEVEGVTENPLIDTFDPAIFAYDPIMGLLGKSFAEVRRILGDPQKEGYQDQFGPSNFMLYQNEDNFMELYSPAGLKEDIVISIILYSGYEIMGVKVGMDMEEIIEVLGMPEYGPELSMDNMYYMDYHFGDAEDSIPEVFVSFAAESMDSPTQNVYIKWEAFRDGFDADPVTE